MDKAKINDLFEKAHVVYETPYESSVVDSSIVSVHKQRVFDRYLFAELIAKECAKVVRNTDLEDVDGGDSAVLRAASEAIENYFGVK